MSWEWNTYHNDGEVNSLKRLIFVCVTLNADIRNSGNVKRKLRFVCPIRGAVEWNEFG